MSYITEIYKTNMKLKAQVIEMLKDTGTRSSLAAKLDCGDQVIYVHLKDNKENGRLTKMDALTAISEITGVDILEILESEAETV